MRTDFHVPYINGAVEPEFTSFWAIENKESLDDLRWAIQGIGRSTQWAEEHESASLSRIGAFAGLLYSATEKLHREQYVVWKLGEFVKEIGLGATYVERIYCDVLRETRSE